MPAASTLRAGCPMVVSGTMDSHLLVVSGVSSCRRSGRSEAEMNLREIIAVERVTSLETATITKASDGYRGYD